MEVKFQLRPQMVWDLYRTLENMELESIALWILSIVLSPFIFSTLWSLGLTVIMQLFWIGLKAGFILHTMSVVYLAYAKATNWKSFVFGGKQWGEKSVKCSLLDVIFSVIFQTGIRIPAFVWDPMMEFIGYVTSKSTRAPANKTILKEEAETCFADLQQHEREEHSQSTGGEAEPEVSYVQFQPIFEDFEYFDGHCGGNSCGRRITTIVKNKNSHRSITITNSLSYGTHHSFSSYHQFD